MLTKMRKMLLLERLGKVSAASCLIWRRRDEARKKRTETVDWSGVKERRVRTGEVKWWTL